MNKKYLISDVLEDGTAIHTPTLEEAERIVNLFLSKGIGKKDDNDVRHWNTYKEKTCYNLNGGKRVSYANKSFYEIEKYKIVESRNVVKELTKSNINKTAPIKMNELITLFRRGFFVTKNFTSTQCTTEGHEAYTYQATLKCGYTLDTHGFIVDHTLIHKAITEYIEDKPMYSCEVMSKNLTHLVVDFTKENNCDLREIEFTIIPVKKSQLKLDGEGNWVAKNPLTINYNMPANAIYHLGVDEAYKSILTDEDRAKYVRGVVKPVPVAVTKDNAFAGMRVVKGEGWLNSNYSLKEGEVGVILKRHDRFPENPETDKVEVKWNNSESDVYYKIGGQGEPSELNIAPDSLTKEESVKSFKPVTKENAVLGLRVIKGQGWTSSNEDIEEGEEGTIVKSKGRFPTKEDSNFVAVNWDETGFTNDYYDISDSESSELALTSEQYKGSISNFPIEVVSKMLERQKEQGNEEYGIEVFEEKNHNGKRKRGFTWEYTTEGYDFWHDVIAEEDFELFFNKYPKK